MAENVYREAKIITSEGKVLHHAIVQEAQRYAEFFLTKTSHLLI